MSSSDIHSTLIHYLQDAEMEAELTRWKYWDFEGGFKRGINLTSNDLGRYSMLL